MRELKKILCQETKISEDEVATLSVQQAHSLTSFNFADVLEAYTIGYERLL